MTNVVKKGSSVNALHVVPLVVKLPANRRQAPPTFKGATARLTYGRSVDAAALLDAMMLAANIATTDPSVLAERLGISVHLIEANDTLSLEPGVDATWQRWSIADGFLDADAPGVIACRRDIRGMRRRWLIAREVAWAMIGRWKIGIAARDGRMTVAMAFADEFLARSPLRVVVDNTARENEAASSAGRE